MLLKTLAKGCVFLEKLLSPMLYDSALDKRLLSRYLYIK